MITDMDKTIEIYGELIHVKPNYEDFYITIKEDGTERRFDVFVPQDNLHWSLDDTEHVYVRGTLSLNVVHADYVDRWGRYCDNCGKHHTEGWYVREDLYACSDECAVALCGGNEEDFRAGIIVDENGDITDDAYTYWTEWE